VSLPFDLHSYGPYIEEHAMLHKIFRLFFVLILVSGLVAVQAPRSARAAGPWYVATTGDDNNDCLGPSTPCATINGAIGKASSGDIVNIAEGTYTGSGSEVVLLDKDVTISGGWDEAFITQSATSTLDGQGLRRGITVNSGVTTMVERILAQNGNAGSDGGGGIYNSGILTLNYSSINANSAAIGGGIINFTGTLTLNNSTVRSNTSRTDEIFNGNGGGIYNWGTLTLNSSTVSGNMGRSGGGIYSGGIFGGGMLTLNNSTVSGNTAPNAPFGGNFGGGIYNFSGTLILNNSTVTANSAVSGGGIYPNSGVVTLKNSILAGNSAEGDGQDCFSTIGSGGHNLLGSTTSCNFTQGSDDLLSVDPLLGPLQDNGGPTFTHALLPGSPAIDAGNPAGCTDQNGNLLTTDQRGVSRPQGARCDIGAFELEATGGVQEVTIDIKPGSQTNPINSMSLGTIPVAILSSADFDAPSEVDRTSLTFGRTGDEHSLVFCNKNGADVNGDGLLDLLCHFKTRLTGFQIGDSVGTLMGQTVNDVPIEGQDIVKIVRK
jgi:hypothetical protein